MKAIDRLYSYLESKQIKPTVFERNIGFSSGYLSNMKKRQADLGESIFLKLNDYCQDLNIEWLISGKGEMIQSKRKESSQTENETKSIDLNKIIELSTQLGQQINENKHLNEENIKLKSEIEKLKNNGKNGHVSKLSYVAEP